NLDLAFDKLAWHGPNLMGSLRGVDFGNAARRLHGRRSIWEQTLHCAYWKRIVLNKLSGTERFPRAGSNWPKMPSLPTRKLWRADIQLLQELHVALRRAVLELDSRVNPALARLILGAAAHDIYHAGQIRLLRRMLGLSRRSSGID